MMRDSVPFAPRLRRTGCGIHQTRRDVVLGIGTAILGATGAWGATPAATSEWVRSKGVAVRLIDAGPDRTGPDLQRLVGIDIALDPGFLTYWRSPGEAGLPPTADFTASTNLAAADLLYPAPMRYDEGGSEAFGYKDRVIFPVRVRPADPAQPIVFAMSLTFAVCANICLPAGATLALTLASKGSPEAETVVEALRRVPQAQAVGAGGPLAIERVSRTSIPGSFAVMVHAPMTDALPSLFAEAPDGWFVVAGPGVPVGDGRSQFPLDVVGRPDATSGLPPSTTLTLVTASDAIEVRTNLGAAGTKP